MAHSVHHSERKYFKSVTPAHTHDCEACTFLGNLFDAGTGESLDCYLHGSTETGTLIARFHSDGAEYYSTPMQLANQGRMGDALERAYHLLKAQF